MTLMAEPFLTHICNVNRFLGYFKEYKSLLKLYMCVCQYVCAFVVNTYFVSISSKYVSLYDIFHQTLNTSATMNIQNVL